ncbi:trigger factor [Rhodovarius sp.]|uniref:trigger factor n=1 Tax=Rhodovarius sp. TaxID=2972673 RepID=UPI00333E295A
MQVTEVSNDGLKRAYSVVVPATDIAAQKSKRLAAIAKDIKIPGFRPGKVPASVIQQRYGQAVMGEVLEASVQDASEKVVSERNLRPAAQPKIELVNFAEGADLEFRMDVEVLPEIPMPDFASIALTRLKATPTDEDIEKALETIARRQATLEETESRPAARGEVLVADFVGTIDGEAFQGGSGTDMPIEVGGQGFIPGFSEPLEGMSPGETRVVDVTFPAEYGAQDLAGKAAQFTITAKALKIYSKPAMDDELAKKIGMESFEKLREAIMLSLQNEYDQQSRLRIKRALLDALAERAAFAVPDSLLDGEFSTIWQRVEADMKAGKLDGDDVGKDEETLRADYRAIAERRVRLGLLLTEIGRTNNIQVANEEISRAMYAEAQRYPGQEKMVLEFFQKNPGAIENLRSPIFEEKVVDFMLELAKVDEKSVTAEELAAAA